MAEPTIDTGPTPWRKAGWVICGLTLIGLFALIARISPLLHWASGSSQPARHPVGLLVGLWSAAGGVFIVAALLLYRARPMNVRWLVWVGLVGLACRGIMWFSSPILENDFYRYLWDGAVLAHGISPYAWSPLQAREGRAPHVLNELAEQAPQVVYRINFPHQRSIYPPVSQVFFALAHHIAPWNLQALRAMFLGFELLTVILLALALVRLRRPVEWVMLYWWCPLLIKDFINGAHLDPIVIFFTTAAVVVLLHGWSVWSYGLLALAIAAKLWPAVLVPLWITYTWKNRPGTIMGLTGLLALSALLLGPYLYQHHGQTSGLVRYIQAWENNTAHYQPLLYAWQAVLEVRGIHPGHAHRLVRATLAVGMLAWLVLLVRRPIGDEPTFLRRCTLAVAGLFLLSPTQFPWYFGSVALFIALSPWWPMLAYAALLPLYHLHYDHPAVTWIEHGPVWLFILADLLARCRRKYRADTPPSLAQSPAAPPANPPAQP